METRHNTKNTNNKVWEHNKQQTDNIIGYEEVMYIR